MSHAILYDWVAASAGADAGVGDVGGRALIMIMNMIIIIIIIMLMLMMVYT